MSGTLAQADARAQARGHQVSGVALVGRMNRGSAMAMPKKPQRTTRSRTSRPQAAAPPAEDSAQAAKTPQRVAIDAAFLNQAELRTGLRENLGPVGVDADRVTERVQTAFEAFNPSGLSAEELARRNHVERGSDPSATLDKVIHRRLSAIREAKPRSTLTVQYSGASSKLIKTTKAADGSVSHTISLGALVDFIGQRQDGLTAIGATSAGASCIAEVKADQVIAAIDASSPHDTPAAPPSADGVADPATVDELVECTVNRQMRSATAPEAKPEFATIPNGADGDQAQAGLLQTFELRPGASDVTSYHDFNMLQIAFEHVWTQMFDGEIAALGRELYREYVGLKDFLGYTAPDTPIGTLDDLRRLMAEIQELSKIAQDGLPSSLDSGSTNRDDAPKGAGDLGNQLGDDIAAVTTGGLSVLVEWAIREFGKAGQKPVLTWDDVDGGVLNRGDRIKATIEDGIAAPGTIQLVLLTDGNSHKKEFAFQTYVEQTGGFVNVLFVTNFLQDAQIVDGGQHIRGSGTIQTSDVPIGMIEFATEETSTYALGRYVLGGLGQRLKDGARVTFYWTDN
jgi:hypothetical protein